MSPSLRIVSSLRIVVLLALAALLNTACFETKTREALACSPSGACPSRQQCFDGTCYLEGHQPVADSGPPDATPFTCIAQTLASGQESASELDAQDTDYVYWTANTSTVVLRSPQSTGLLEVFHDSGAGRHPYAVTTDATHVYWTENDVIGRVMRKAKASAEADPAQELVQGQNQPSHLVVDATHLYWANLGGNAIRRIAIGGGAVEDIATSQGAPDSLAIDQSQVFWVNSVTGQIMRSDKDGLGQQQLAGGQSGVSDIALSTDSVYWPVPGSDEIRTVGKTGGAVTTAIDKQRGVSTVAVDGEYLYWGNKGSGDIVRAELADMVPQQIIDGQLEPVALEIEGGALYWLNALDATNRLVRTTCNSL